MFPLFTLRLHASPGSLAICLAMFIPHSVALVDLPVLEAHSSFGTGFNMISSDLGKRTKPTLEQWGFLWGSAEAPQSRDGQRRGKAEIIHYQTVAL